MDFWTSDLTGEKYEDFSLIEESNCGSTATKQEFEEDCNYEWCKDTSSYSSDCWYSDLGDCWYSDGTEDVYSYDGNTCGTSEEFQCSSSFRWCEDVCEYSSEYIYVEDIEEYWRHDDDCYYFDGAYYANPPYSDDENICDYHESGEPRDLSNGAEFRIGFEIEKTDFNGLDCQGEHVGSFTLFKGFETDSSCGVEAITNILPLDDSEGRSQVFDWIDEAEWVIESNTDKHCSCHTNISVEGLDERDLFLKLRPYMSIVYAVFRYRLKNTYCKNNKMLDLGSRTTNYSCAKVKGDVLEIRLPSRIINKKQLKNRYDFFYALVKSAMSTLSREDFIETMTPELIKMYSGDVQKVESILEYEKDFNDFILNGTQTDLITNFI